MGGGALNGSAASVFAVSETRSKPQRALADTSVGKRPISSAAPIYRIHRCRTPSTRREKIRNMFFIFVSSDGFNLHEETFPQSFKRISKRNARIDSEGQSVQFNRKLSCSCLFETANRLPDRFAIPSKFFSARFMNTCVFPQGVVRRQEYRKTCLKGPKQLQPGRNSMRSASREGP